MASSHLVDPPGTIHSAGDGIVELARLLTGARWLAKLADRSPRVRTAIDRSYVAVATQRDRLARLVPDLAPTVRSCSIQDAHRSFG